MGSVVHFKSLRLHGFKSFVEPTELVIDRGMTGIVGPNGCGKSNLVEALRWVMGETSAKRMRGTDMDDVIFAGTATRPARDVAEVKLCLDNQSRTVMAAFNDADQLDVVRQIERESGSDYRINGKPVRQRDVQLLFADNATGAHSTSVVGQGQIDALIRAKPQDRRQILEEAAGTSGLQSRRHEAELKLKAAEQNLTRADDVLKAYDTQLRSLKQQVKQASRYRNLAEHIRNTEAALLQLKWAEAEGNAETVRASLAETEKRVNDLMLVVTEGTTKRTEAAAGLPDLRQTEAGKAVVVQKLTLAREQIDAEARRIASETSSREYLLSQATEDLTRENERQRDGTAATLRLTEEETQQTSRGIEIDAILPDVASDWEKLNAEVAALESALHACLTETANAEAKQNALLQEIASLTQRRANLMQRREQQEAQKAALEAEIASRPDLALAKSMVDACETELAKRQDQAAEAEKARGESDRVLAEKRDAMQESSQQVMRLSAEAEALTAMLTHGGAEEGAVLDLITVSPGLENALAVALGEALTAALDPAAARHWRELPPLSDASLPEGATPFASFIQAPQAMTRSLSQIGLVEEAEAGHHLAAELKPGQILVSRDGWAWRWDGFTVTPEAKTTTAVRLQQRNRLTALQSEIEAAKKTLAAAEADVASAEATLKQCQELDQKTREALRSAFAALNDARNLYAKQERESAESIARLNAANETLGGLARDLAEVETRLSETEEERQALPNVENLRNEATSKRASLAESRTLLMQKQSERDQLTQEKNRIASRLAAIGQEKAAWAERTEAATQQAEELKTRIADLTSQLEELRAKPAVLAESRSKLLDELSAAEAERQTAADAVILAEQNLSQIEAQLKHDEADLASAREDRVRAEGAVQAVAEHFSVLREKIQEKLNCAPEGLAEIVKPSEETPNLYELEQTLSRFVRERDNMGPVNLRAEVEAETVQNDITKLTQEKDDLVAAIAKLRQGISALNKEARERLQVAFTAVNEKFETLFKTLFNGGKAHLELIDAEDPMNAGLEIFAAPPGKKQQVLSLLSGGERTLTAIALLFAVFQTNPSPICVLDEAEAALDESNISRYCDLIEKIASETGTRFLIITHHRLTMARMDRLYGVTMSEKGVSQLVSVDLSAAVAMRDGAPVEKAAEALQAVQAA
jgi:chromosome segregation protein